MQLLSVAGVYHQLRKLTILFSLAITAYPGIGFSDEDVWAKLKQGGYVVLMRHATAEKTNDPLVLKVDDCTVQRNLSSKGQEEARFIEKVFRSRFIPVGEVLSSRYCRTQETAKLAFGFVSTWQPLDLLYALPDQERDTRTETVAQRIGAFVGKDNLVMVTHRPNIDALTLELVEPGGFLVLEPEQNGSFDIVGGITLGDIEMK
jgi:phosphohistidine phosphatase SixA